MPIYSSNEIMDILLILGEYYRHYRIAFHLYREKFSSVKDHSTLDNMFNEMRIHRRVVEEEE